MRDRNLGRAECDGAYATERAAFDGNLGVQALLICTIRVQCSDHFCCLRIENADLLVDVLPAQRDRRQLAIPAPVNQI